MQRLPATIEPHLQYLKAKKCNSCLLSILTAWEESKTLEIESLRFNEQRCQSSLCSRMSIRAQSVFYFCNSFQIPKFIAFAKLLPLLSSISLSLSISISLSLDILLKNRAPNNAINFLSKFMRFATLKAVRGLKADPWLE